MTSQEYIEQTLDYWIGYFMALEDLSDGAWWAAMESGFEEGMQDCYEALDVLPPDVVDTNELVHIYLRMYAERNK